MKQTDLAWAAGLFEGEGWISSQKRNAIIGIQMCDKDVLERFAAIVGCGNIYYRKPRIYSYEVIKSRKEQWSWRLGRRTDVQRVLAQLRPWLSNRRKERADEVLALAASANEKPGMPRGHQTKKVSEYPHGEVRKYWRGCKCDMCLAANRDYSAARRKHKLASTSPV